MRIREDAGFPNPYYFADATELRPSGKMNRGGEVELSAVGHILPHNSGYQKDQDGNQIIWLHKDLLAEEPARDRVSLACLTFY